MPGKFQTGEMPCELWQNSMTGPRLERSGVIRTTYDGLALYQGPADVDEAFGFLLPDGSFELAQHLIGNRERVVSDYSGVAKMRWDGQRWVELQRIQLFVSVRRPEQEQNESIA
jgi:hypothetical protein